MTDIEKYKAILDKTLTDVPGKEGYIDKILSETFGYESLDTLKQAVLEIKPINTSVMDNLLVYTDGACAGNPGKGAAAMVVIKGGDIIHKKVHKEHKTTNNRMEIQAVLDSLKWLSENSFGSAIIRSDSTYVVNTLTKGWLESWESTNYKGKLNSDLWKQVYALYDPLRDNIEVEWVKAHNGEKYNTLVDFMAVSATKEML